MHLPLGRGGCGEVWEASGLEGQSIALKFMKVRDTSSATREAKSIQLYATAPVRAALEGPFPVGPILSRYTTVEWHDVVPGQWMNLDGGLMVRAVTLGAKRPRYADGLPGEDWVVAYRFVDPATGGVIATKSLPPLLSTSTTSYIPSL